MKRENKKTLADKIAGIFNTAPSSFDPEDDAGDVTSAQVSHGSIEEPQEEEALLLSKFRVANVDLLADLDEKYSGKKTSRKHLKESDSEGSIHSDADGDHDDDSDDDDDDDDDDENDNDEDNDEGGNDEDSSESESSITETLETDGKFSDGEETIKHMSETNVSNQIKKGLCVKNQMTMWENLLEMRIQLQKCLLTTNKMPQPATFTEIKKESGQEFSNKVNETTTTLSATLDKLLLLKTLVERQFPETRNLGQQATSTNDNNDIDEEEIPSDTENEESADEEVDSKPTVRKGKKRKLEEYEKEISDQHKRYKHYRNSVVQKWNDKTRVVVKGGTSNHSILDQIEYNLSNRDKLIKRTQMRRSQYTILGEESNDEEFNTEIFDDDDFYHQLLRELIEVKSADVTDPVQLGRQWIQLQNLRSKMKRKVDTKATKGRKIRYVVHSKLVNFMAPIDENLCTDDAKDILYNAIFGKNKAN